MFINSSKYHRTSFSVKINLFTISPTFSLFTMKKGNFSKPDNQDFDDNYEEQIKWFNRVCKHMIILTLK